MIPRYYLAGYADSTSQPVMVDSDKKLTSFPPVINRVMDINELITANIEEMLQSISLLSKCPIERLVINAQGLPGRIDATILTTNPHRYARPCPKIMEEYEKGERAMYQSTMSFYVRSEVGVSDWRYVPLNDQVWVISAGDRLKNAINDARRCIEKYQPGYKHVGAHNEAIKVGYLPGSPGHKAFVFHVMDRVKHLTVDGDNRIVDVEINLRGEI